MKKLFLTFVSVCGLMSSVQHAQAQSQLTNFAMYNYAPTLNNAAMLGNTDELMVKYGYRSQALPNGQAFTTHLVTVGMPFYFGAEKHSRLTVGGSFLLDKQTQFFKTTGFVVNTSYTIRLGKHNYLGAGFQAGFSQRGVDLKGSVENQYNPNTGQFDATREFNERIDGQNKSFNSFDAGLYWTMRDEYGDDRAYLGVSGHGVNRPNVSLVGDQSDRLATRLITVGGVTVFHQNHLSIVPNFRWMNQAGNNLLNVGSWVRYGIGDIHKETQRKVGSIGAGLWYNLNGGLITSLELHMPKFFASVCYTLPTESGTNLAQTAGVLEFCVGAKIRRKEKVVTEGYGTKP